ncbi:electron transfer flavoprotein subunit beta/FixA family protein [Calidifontibacillus erzurumensis]|uniref:Electron transfer flavoprotein subunit beta/FixA family protein n=1 Tax=Calidifontibacillus erzurumensis TaxID=2741433 RepID=A0A8J8GGE4_9BACI|nr:electron transfer flavoprotein subunit beta/FixA family protein [Calidifontibacillus erzurumensis]NSL51903.1 electron transfer flavoprotein subunit beta/FixA family protein [Calidifontibacillus erzurumensis]
MKILVCVKHVVDTTEVRVDQNGELVLRGVPTKINDYDKNAIEEAVKIKQATNGEVTLLTIGPKEAQKTLKEGLAMGADNAYLVEDTDVSKYDSVQIAKILSKAIQKLGGFDLIFAGSVSEDISNNITGISLAEWLGYENISYVQKIDVAGSKVTTERKIGQTIETIEAELPVVVTVDRSINTPRLPTAIQIMKVKANRIKTMSLSELDNLDGVTANVSLRDYNIVSTQRKKVIFEGDLDGAVNNLVEELSREGVF